MTENKSVLRKFSLPNEEDLNKDQDMVYDLPENGQYLIVGGPGTGKSVVALLRALKYHKNDNYLFLTFNHVLLKATRQLVDIDLKANTLDSFIWSFCLRILKKYIKDFDLELLIKEAKSADLPNNPLHLIIDEGQDKSPLYYEALISLGLRNFFIVADQNQQITEQHSSRSDLTDTLGLETSDVIELKQNYRNTFSIARLCQHFYTDKASPAPELPSVDKKSLSTPIMFDYHNFEDCIKFILRESDKDPRNLIGIITKNHTTRSKVVEALNNTNIKLDNPKAKISTYTNEGNDKKIVNIDFSRGGICALCSASVKGTEFDIVFVMVDDFDIYNNDVDGMRKQFYVMCSRAIKKVVLFKSVNYRGKVTEILPVDEKLLMRREI